jgi:hypothetical protein
VLPRPGFSRDVLGLADWDGSLHYSEPHVLAPLRELFAHPGQARTNQALYHCKEAVLTVFHENNHLLAPSDSEHGEAATTWDWPYVVLEEGVTEAYSRLRLHAFIDALGLEEMAPGLRATQIGVAYPQYVPAVITLTSRVAEVANSSLEAVLERLNAETPAGKYPRLADLALGGRGGVSPPARARQRRRALERDLGEVLGRARFFAGASPQNHQQLSEALGSEAVRVLDEHLARLHARASISPPAATRTRTAAWLQTAATPGSKRYARATQAACRRPPPELTR